MVNNVSPGPVETLFVTIRSGAESYGTLGVASSSLLTIVAFYRERRMESTTILGAAAAIASTVSFAPQAWRIIHTADTKAISTGTYIVTVIGFALWTGYGVALGQWPLVASNSICLLLSGFILVMKLLPTTKKKRVRKALTDH